MPRASDCETWSLYPSGTRPSDAKLWVLWLHQKTWSSVGDAAWKVVGPGWQDQVVQNGPLKSYSLAPRLVPFSLLPDLQNVNKAVPKLWLPGAKLPPTCHAFSSMRDWDLWRSEQNNSPCFAHVRYYVRVVRKVANTLSKGKTVTFTHQQHSALIRGSERQLLALWVTQLKMAVWMKSNPCFRESIMKRKSIKNTMRKLLLLKPKRCWRNPKGRLYLRPDLQFLMY